MKRKVVLKIDKKDPEIVKVKRRLFVKRIRELGLNVKTLKPTPMRTKAKGVHGKAYNLIVFRGKHKEREKKKLQKVSRT